MLKFRFAAPVVLVAGALLTVAGCGGTAGAGSSNGGSVQGQAVTLHYKIVASDDDQAKTGPDGKKHDTFWTTDSTSLHVGDKVTIVVENTDDMMHSMTFPALNINQMIAAGKDDKPSQTTFTFTADKAGTYRWFCAIPCDTDSEGWAMKVGASGPDQDGFMAGTITVS